MNFTREPIIETVITPRDGYKLAIRSSKGLNQEDYLVDAVEVVSFGHSFFFRSQEGTKTFLVPISDYEVLEVKEARLALKNASPDRSIKISGGRDAPPRAPREMRVPEAEEEEAPPTDGRGFSSERPPERTDRKRDRSRRRGRRGRDRNDAYPQQQGPVQNEPNPPGQQEEPAFTGSHEPTAERPPEEHKAPSFISKLFPPPTMLIKETLGRYKLPDPSAEDISTLSEGSSQEKESFDDPFSEPPYLPDDQRRSREEPDSEEE